MNDYVPFAKLTEQLSRWSRGLCRVSLRRGYGHSWQCHGNDGPEPGDKCDCGMRIFWNGQSFDSDDYELFSSTAVLPDRDRYLG